MKTLLVDADMRKDNNGYMRIGTEYVHRLLAELVLGRKLKTKEQVHHVDEDKSNNTNSNLVICPDEAYHKLLHSRQRIVDMGGNPNTDKYCKYHDKLHKRTEFSTASHYDGLSNYCREATNQYRKENGLNKSKFNWKSRLNQQYRRLFSKYTNREVCKL